MATTVDQVLIGGLKAGADLSADSNFHRAVKFDGSGDVVLAGAGEAAIGFLQNQPTLGQFVEVAGVGGGSLAVAAATLAAGVFCKADASGDLIAAVAGDEIIARTLDSAVDNDHFAVQVLSRTLHA